MQAAFDTYVRRFDPTIGGTTAQKYQLMVGGYVSLNIFSGVPSITLT